MRILFLENHPMWVNGLPNGFRDSGHQVCIPVSFAERDLLDTADRFRPDLLFTIGWTPVNSIAADQEKIGRVAQHAGVPHIYWATEDPGYTDVFSLPYIKRARVDFAFTIDPATVEMYRNLGIGSDYLDFGYHSSVHKPVPSNPAFAAVGALVANGYSQLYEQKPYKYRFRSLRLLVNPFLEGGHSISLYGRYWDRMHKIFDRPVPNHSIRGYLPYEEAAAVYSTAYFTVCPQNAPDRLTQRIYEVMASGGLVLTSDTPAIRRLFQPGEHLLAAATEAEGSQWIRRLLEDPEERRAIQSQGMEAVRPHSYRNRALSILKSLRRERLISDSIE